MPVSTSLFHVSTTCMVPLLLLLVDEKSILDLFNVIITFFAAHGVTVTGMIIGSIPGMFIVMASDHALKLGYNVISNFPVSTMKLFPFTNENCVFVTQFFVMVFSLIFHGINIPCLLTTLATVSRFLLSVVLMVILMLGMFSGTICLMPFSSAYWIADSSFGRLNDIFGVLICLISVLYST